MNQAPTKKSSFKKSENGARLHFFMNQTPTKKSSVYIKRYRKKGTGCFFKSLKMEPGSIFQAPFFKSLIPIVLIPIVIWFWIFEPVFLPEHA